jgi:predicted DNA-binding ribbon-helix-helix protein
VKAKRSDDHAGKAAAAHPIPQGGVTRMTITPPPGGFAGPVKRSVTIAGHETSLALEPVFWRALEAAAAARGLPLNALVAAIDAARIEAARPPNLASAIRTWLMHEDATRSQ